MVATRTGSPSLWRSPLLIDRLNHRRNKGSGKKASRDNQTKTNHKPKDLYNARHGFTESKGLQHEGSGTVAQPTLTGLRTSALSPAERPERPQEGA